ncbi:MAG: division/cell wall cluster transcriptional repressor MraZ [Rubricella sp.]
MARRFRGEWRHKVDGKGRVSVPAPFRKVLAADDSERAADDPVAVTLIYGRKDRACLEGFSVNGISRIDTLIDQMPVFSPEREQISWMMSAQSSDLEIDEAGRLLLSKPLRDRVGLKGNEVVFVGMTDRFQIWDPDAYDAHLATMERAQSADGDMFALLHAAQEKFGL